RRSSAFHDDQSGRPHQARAAFRRAARADAIGDMARRELVRARDVGDVRHHVRRPSASGEARIARAVRGPSAAQGFRADDAGGQALARSGRGGGRGGGVIHALLAAAAAGAGPQNFLNSTFSNFWFVLILKVVLLMGLFLTAPLAVGYVEHKTLAHMQ